MFSVSVIWRNYDSPKNKGTCLKLNMENREGRGVNVRLREALLKKTYDYKKTSLQGTIKEKFRKNTWTKRNVRRERGNNKKFWKVPREQIEIWKETREEGTKIIFGRDHGNRWFLEGTVGTKRNFERDHGRKEKFERTKRNFGRENGSKEKLWKDKEKFWKACTTRTTGGAGIIPFS